MRTEIDSANVFARLVETELTFRDGPGARSALDKAERACEVAGQFIGMAHLRHQHVEALEKELEDTRTTVAHLRERVTAAGPQLEEP